MSQRVERVQRLAREVLGEEIGNLKDPRIGFITITKVRMTPDLREAHVLISVLGSPEDQDASMAGLKSATPHLRAELGRQIRLKYLPSLVFELDKASESAERIELLLRRIHQENLPS